MSIVDKQLLQKLFIDNQDIAEVIMSMLQLCWHTISPTNMTIIITIYIIIGWLYFRLFL
jgi:hypothetical protein